MRPRGAGGVRRASRPATRRRATGDFNRAIKLDPNLAAAYRNQGYAWHLRGDESPAIGHLDKAIQLDPKNAQADFQRGVAWIAKGDLDTAIGTLGKAISLDDPSRRHAIDTTVGKPAYLGSVVPIMNV